MPLCININVNNSDMSIKNERIGTKKYVKAINVRNLNHMTDRQQMMDEKRTSARKQAIKLISDAWKSDNKATDNINVMDKAKETIAIRNNELMSKLKDIKDSQEALREQYGVDKNSEEQKDLELLIKYQDNKTGIFSDKFSKEEIERLKELQSQPLTEYQKKSLMINAGKDSVYNELDRNETKAMSLTMSINDAKTEQLKSQDMLKAQEEIAQMETEATAGGGAVKAVVSGTNVLKAIELKPEVVDADDVEMLQDLILAAVNEAFRQAAEKSEQQMKQITGGMGGGMPGLF